MEPMFQQLGIAVLLGLLVGLQREHTASGIAGMRTFPLVTVLGCLTTMIAIRLGNGWIVAAAMLGVVVLAVIGHWLHEEDARVQEALARNTHPGITTDAAMLVMFAVGAFLAIGEIPVAVAVGGGVAVLLQFKPELHGIARRLGDEDLRAIMQFVLITCIILPVLPDRGYGPSSFFKLPHPTPELNVLNPREIWWMVVLIVGMSLGGYLLYKYFGRNAGILLGGVLGGAISSTATTVSYSRGMRGNPGAMRSAAVVIMIASAVMYLRVLLAVAVVSSWEFLQTVLLPVSILMLLTLLPALALWYRVRHEPAQMPEQENPTQLKSAVVFGVLYAMVLMALALAQYFWHGRGLYAVAFLSGLTEMDALTLSTARMSANDAMILTDGWRLIVIAALANSVSKAAIAGLLGGWQLLARIVALFAIPAVGGAAMLLLL